VVAVFDRQIGGHVADVMMVNDGDNLGRVKMSDRLVDGTVVGQGDLSSLVVSGMVCVKMYGKMLKKKRLLLIKK
jgi:hypothetical protein